jgi:CCR4-NOT transcription complex subunit 7/8
MHPSASRPGGGVAVDLGAIRDVWAHNLKEEMEKMRDIGEDYPYVAVDTEFPGCVAKPSGTFRSAKEYNYQTVKCNVDLLKVIQIGLTFCDSSGNTPPGVSTWQFNFSFDLVQDLYAQESIEFLRGCGINFDRHVHQGIAVEDFAEQLTTSGIVLNEEVKWISFHGSYDFAYLLKILTCQLLPDDEDVFFDLIHTYFPALYDVKFLLRGTGEDFQRISMGSLNRIAEALEVNRVGEAHQAGSDSLVTALAFFRLIERHFDNQVDDSKYAGVLYGLGEGAADGAETLELLAPRQPVQEASHFWGQNGHGGGKGQWAGKGGGGLGMHGGYGAGYNGQAM